MFGNVDDALLQVYNKRGSRLKLVVRTAYECSLWVHLEVFAARTQLSADLCQRFISWSGQETKLWFLSLSTSPLCGLVAKSSFTNQGLAGVANMSEVEGFQLHEQVLVGGVSVAIGRFDGVDDPQVHSLHSWPRRLNCCSRHAKKPIHLV